MSELNKRRSDPILGLELALLMVSTILQSVNWVITPDWKPERLTKVLEGIHSFKALMIRFPDSHVGLTQHF